MNSAENSAVTRVAEALAAAGHPCDLRTFESPVPTATAAAAMLGCDVGAIANSLIFEEAGEPVLILASGAHRVVTNVVSSRLGLGPIRRATPEFVLAHTGQLVGGVAPVGHPRPLRTVIDLWLEPFDVVWAGAGDEHSMFATSFSQLVRLTGGIPLDLE